MNAIEDVPGLSECIGQAIQAHLAKANINTSWPQLDALVHPILRVEAFLEDAAPSPTALGATGQSSKRVASVCRQPLFNAGTPCVSRLEFVTHILLDLASAVLIMVWNKRAREVVRVESH